MPEAESQNSGAQSTEQNQSGTQQQTQQQDGGWIATLPEELRGAPAVKKFKGKDWSEVGPQVLKSYVNLEKWQVPGENATPEERAAFARRRGVPEKFDDYKLDVKVPDGVEWTPEIQGEFSKFAFEQGLTPREAQSVVNWYLERAGRGIDMNTTQTAEEMARAHSDLQKRWGANFKRNTGLVQRAVEEYGSESFSNMLNTVVVKGPDGQDIKLGNHPAMLEFILARGEDRLEAGFIKGDSIGTTSQDALAQANAILDDPKHPYWQGDKAAVKKVSDLMALAYPDKKRD